MANPKASDKFLIWLHPTGQWCKKHRGQFHDFGTERDAALRLDAETWENI